MSCRVVSCRVVSCRVVSCPALAPHTRSLLPPSSCRPLPTQVVVLSCGRTLYSGPLAGAVPWFSAGLGFAYDPARHGIAPDWIIDLVNVGFDKPQVRKTRSWRAVPREAGAPRRAAASSVPRRTFATRSVVLIDLVIFLSFFLSFFATRPLALCAPPPPPRVPRRRRACTGAP